METDAEVALIPQAHSHLHSFCTTNHYFCHHERSDNGQNGLGRMVISTFTQILLLLLVLSLFVLL
jgi:hypothetical protein